MKLMPFIFFFVFLLLCLGGTPVQAGTPQMVSDSIQADSIPRIKYIGYRLYLTHFEIIKEKKGFLYVKLSAINTGNKKMQLGKGAAQIFPVVKIDPSIGTAGLLDYQTEIYYKLLEEKTTIPIGAISTNLELKLSMEASDSHLAEKALEPETIVETTESIEQVEPEIISTSTASTSNPVNPKEEEEEEGCADLVLKELNVLKRTKNSITLEYQLLNQGSGKAPLVIGQKKEQESIALRAHLSSSEKLTRGAIVINSIFLHGEELTLASGESYTGQVKLALHKLTKFTPVLILELDAYEFISECDEHNNLSRLRLLEDEIH